MSRIYQMAWQRYPGYSANQFGLEQEGNIQFFGNVHSKCYNLLQNPKKNDGIGWHLLISTL